MTNSKKILSVFVAILLIVFSAITPAYAADKGDQYLKITVEVRGSGTAKSSSNRAIGRYIDSITFSAEPADGVEFVRWEIQGDFMYGQSISDYSFNPPQTLKILPLTDIHAIAWFSDADEATPDEATPDEATPDEASPDEATADQATPDQHSIKGVVKTHLSTEDEVRVDVYKYGAEFSEFSLIAYTDEFEFDTGENLDPGKYTVKVSKQAHVPREYTVTLSERDLMMDIELCPLGDINGDGETDVLDATVGLKYIRKLRDLDEYHIKCGDVFGDGDGILDVNDVSRILRHIRKLKPLY